jgi:phage shock protein A
LKAIKTDEPFLYKKFSFDIKRLDSTYTLLKQQLPVNPNKEELLEAMIYNLQLQIELLNQQLNIIQKIKQSKSTSL